MTWLVLGAKAFDENSLIFSGFVFPSWPCDPFSRDWDGCWWSDEYNCFHSIFYFYISAVVDIVAASLFWQYSWMCTGPQGGIIFTNYKEICGQLGIITSIWFSTFRSGLTHSSDAVPRFGNRPYFSYLFCIPFLMVWWILCSCCFDARKRKSGLRCHAIKNI